MNTSTLIAPLPDGSVARPAVEHARSCESGPLADHNNRSYLLAQHKGPKAGPDAIALHTLPGIADR